MSATDANRGTRVRADCLPRAAARRIAAWSAGGVFARPTKCSGFGGGLSRPVSKQPPPPTRATTRVAPTASRPARGVGGTNRRGRACPVPKQPPSPNAGDHKGRPYDVLASARRWGTNRRGRACPVPSQSSRRPPTRATTRVAPTGVTPSCSAARTQQYGRIGEPCPRLRGRHRRGASSYGGNPAYRRPMRSCRSR